MEKEIKKSRIENGHWLYTDLIAHRGLHDMNAGENTMVAFEKAVKAGYAIETDIHVTKDKKVVVFHDDTLSRATDGKDTREVNSLTLEELQKVEIFGGYKIPTLQELLALTMGKSPLLIEYKKVAGEDSSLEVAAAKFLDEYEGDFAVQSFNPSVLAWHKANRPEVLRGQLSSYFKGDKLSFLKKIVLKHMAFNRSNEPDFVSYNAKYIPNKYVSRFKNNTGGVVIAWTVRSQGEYEKIAKHINNIIFEDFIPKRV